MNGVDSLIENFGDFTSLSVRKWQRKNALKYVTTAMRVPSDPKNVFFPLINLQLRDVSQALCCHNQLCVDVILNLLQTDQFTDITRPGETLHGSKHVSLPLGAGFEDRSENHDILRPIVNIIVPNSKEDVLSPYSK